MVTPSDLCADAAFVNGKIITVDEYDAFAEAVAVKGGRILRAGSDDYVGGVFFEGALGEISELEFIEGKVLVVTGANGTLRIDICESKLMGDLTKSET